MSVTRYVDVKIPVKVVDSIYTTGWYGRPGGRGGIVHVKLKGQHTPLCGARVHPESHFQWCANGIHEQYVECRTCQRIIAPIVAGAAA